MKNTEGEKELTMFRLYAIVFFCALLAVALVAPPPSTAQEAVPILTQMITLAKQNGGGGHEARLEALTQQIEALPTPARGDRTAARLYNDKALGALKKAQYDHALQSFTTAYQLDPGDVEVVNNVGFAYLKTGNLPEATRYIEIALSMAPRRAAAWANLAEVYARSARPEEAVAAYALTWRFSKDRDTTRRYLETQATTADNPQVMQAAKQALALSLISSRAASEKVPGPSTPGVTDASFVWTKDRAPQFGDFPVRTIYRGRPAPVDFRSYPTDSHSDPEMERQIRMEITQGAKKGPNFAGHYTVVELGCGSNCQVFTIVDAITGKGCDGEGGERGAEFRLDSHLFIADPPYPSEWNAYPDHPSATLPVRYYVWANNKLKLVYAEDCTVINNKQKCGGK